MRPHLRRPLVIIAAAFICVGMGIVWWQLGPMQTYRMPGATLHIRAGHAHSAHHSFRKGLERAKTIIELESDGRIQLDFFPEEQLGSERQMQEMLSAGTLDMAVSGVLNSFDPVFALVEMPYLYRDRDHAKRVFAGPVLDTLDALAALHGVKILGVMEVGWRDITADRPVRVPADLAGLAIRTPEDPAMIETFRALGARPVPLSFNQIYEALAAKVVDGEENPLENIYDDGLYRVQRFVMITHHIYNIAYVLVSMRLWLRLPPRDRTLVAHAVREGCAAQMDFASQQEREYARRLKEQGMRFIDPDTAAFRAASAGAYQSEFVKQQGPRAAWIFEQVKQCAGADAVPKPRADPAAARNPESGAP
jgi:tripartite ATP-independent transporter DctP family solute receptor